MMAFPIGVPAESDDGGLGPSTADAGANGASIKPGDADLAFAQRRERDPDFRIKPARSADKEKQPGWAWDASIPILNSSRCYT